MKGRTLCAGHEKQVTVRSQQYNIPRSDAMDQLWNMYEEEMYAIQADNEAQIYADETEHSNGYPAGTIGSETR